MFLIEFTALFTKPSDCLPPAGIHSADHSAIYGLRDFLHSTGIVPGKARNSSAGSFVNHAVTALPKKPLASRFMAISTGLPGIIPKLSKEAAVENGVQRPFCMAAGCKVALLIALLM